MKLDKQDIFYWGVGAAVVWLFVRAGKKNDKSFLDYAAIIIPQFEGFRAHPYWDVSRYSWGYGTAAPGSTGTISEQQARADMLQRVQEDYNYLSNLISVDLTPLQWAALLSFSYNLGRGNADNLVYNINRGDWDALREQWLKYVYADGVVNSVLEDRRQKELEYFFY